jgi:hypothetical protein
MLTTARAGKATIQAYNQADESVIDSVSVTMSAPASSAAGISIQASSTVVASSGGGLFNSVDVSAQVIDGSGNPVGSAAVVFSMTDTPGGGEKLSPSVAFTDSSGTAKTTFTSGSLSTTGSGLTITAALLTPSGPSPSILDSIKIVIGGTAGSVVVGESTTISSIASDTTYQLPMSVLVSDSNGSPVPGAIVTINLWPYYYHVGNCIYGVFPEEPTSPFNCTAYPNEDDFYGPGNVFYRNQFLDLGEDDNPIGGNNDGQLTPVNSSSGNMPQSVTTGENGVGTFDWTYLKTYAGFVTAEIKVSTEVQGSETTTTVLRLLRPLKDDVEDEVLSGNSPFAEPPMFPPPTP